MRLKTFIPAILFSTLIACNNNRENQDTKPDSEFEAAKKGIEESNQEWIAALKKRDSAALTDLYTKDAKIISPGNPSTEGREKIAKDMGEAVRAGITGLSDTTLGFWGGNHFYTVEYVETFYDSTGAAVSHGRSLCVWKQEDGKWKLFRDAYIPERHQ